MYRYATNVKIAKRAWKNSINVSLTLNLEKMDISARSDWMTSKKIQDVLKNPKIFSNCKIWKALTVKKIDKKSHELSKMNPT